jgi:protease-4
LPATGWTFDTVGVAIEVYLDGIGGGFSQEVWSASDRIQTAWLGTDEPGESLFRSGRRVPSLAVLDAPPYETSTFLFLDDSGPSWLDLLELIRRAEEQPGVKGLVLTLGSADLSWARLEELRDRIRSLESRNRPVVVYLTGNANTATFHAASAASRVVIHPAATLDLVGTRAELVHLRGAMDLIGVEAQFVRRSEYKGAPEQLARHEPSAYALEQEEALLDDRWEAVLQSLQSGRRVSAETAAELISAGPYSADAALNAGLVDAVAYADNLGAVLEDLHGSRVLVEDLRRAPQARSPWEDPAQIAIIYIDGVIVSGDSSRGGLLGPKTAGSATLVRALTRARDEALVRAVVLRVDSPGGSAFASDEIWHAVERVKEAGKPVVVSFGGVAASGGYYVAAGADAIWAQPTTVTGSIGVFNTKIVTADLQERIGVNTTILTRGKNADLASSARGWDADQREHIQGLVDDVYEQFKERVSAGRDLTPEAVEQVARGRVWSGLRAQEQGLVDSIGGLQDAILDARQRAGIAPSRKVGLVSYSRGGSLLETLAPTLITRAVTQAAQRDLPKTEGLQSLLMPLEPAVLLLAYPNTHVWALDPRFLDEVAQ